MAFHSYSYHTCSYGFSPAINAYRAFGFFCYGNENVLSKHESTDKNKSHIDLAIVHPRAAALQAMITTYILTL